MVDMKYAFLKLQEEAGRLKFVCVSNDSVDEHMVWYLFIFYFLKVHVTSTCLLNIVLLYFISSRLQISVQTLLIFVKYPTAT